MKIKMRELLAMNKYVSSKSATRPYLGGVHIEAHRDNGFAIATNGIVAVVLRIDSAGMDIAESFDFTIPRGFLEGIKIAKAADPYAYISVSGEEFILLYAGVTYSSLPIDGVYPDWRRIFPPTSYDIKPAMYAGETGLLLEKMAKEFGTFAVITPAGDNENALITFDKRDDVCGCTIALRRRIFTTTRPFNF